MSWVIKNHGFSMRFFDLSYSIHMLNNTNNVKVSFNTPSSPGKAFMVNA